MKVLDSSEISWEKTVSKIVQIRLESGRNRLGWLRWCCTELANRRVSSFSWTESSRVEWRCRVWIHKMKWLRV